MKNHDPSIISPRDPNYNAALRDAVINLAPFYDPNHKCGIVREKVFKGCVTELREREKVAREELGEMKLQRDEARFEAKAFRDGYCTAPYPLTWEK